MNIISDVVLYFVFVALTGCFVILPFVGRKNLAFGVSIPRSEYNSKEIRKERISSLLPFLLVGAVALISAILGFRFLSERNAAMVFTALVLAQILAYMLIFLAFRKRVKRIKEEKGWDKEARDIKVVDTAFASKGKIACSFKWFWLYPLVIGATVFVGLYFYDLAPDRIPIQINSIGNVARYVDKSVLSVLYPVIIQVFMSLLFMFVFYTFIKTPPMIDPENAEESSKQNMIFRYRWSVFTVAGGLVMMLNFFGQELSIVGLITMGTAFYFTIGTVILIVIAAVVLSITTGQSGSRVRIGKTKDGEKINRDDDKYWKAGMFYFNKEDPAMFVEKRFGIGMTVNFANRKAVLIFVGVMLFVVVIAIVSSTIK